MIVCAMLLLQLGSEAWAAIGINLIIVATGYGGTVASVKDLKERVKRIEDWIDRNGERRSNPKVRYEP